MTPLIVAVGRPSRPCGGPARDLHILPDVSGQGTPVTQSHPVQEDGVGVLGQGRGRVALPVLGGLGHLPDGCVLVGLVFVLPVQGQLGRAADLVAVVLAQAGHGPDVAQGPAEFLVRDFGELVQNLQGLVRMAMDLLRDLDRGGAGRLLACCDGIHVGRDG